MLNRHVEIRQHPSLAGDDIEKAVGDPGGLEIEHANPRDRRLGDERFEELRELNSVTPVASVMSEILRHEIDLARSLQLEQLRLPYELHRARRSGAYRA